MPVFPTVDQQYTQQLVTDTFAGYDHQLKIPDGEWYDTKNLSSDHAPLMASRKPRGSTNLSATSLLEKDALAYVSENGTLYYNFEPTPVVGLSSGEKQMVGMGAYIVIFPDKVYFNTQDQTDYGSLEAHYTPSSASYQMCRYDGTAVSATAQSSAPLNPTNGQYWIDTSGDTHILKQWSASQDEWVSIETVYVKITFNTLGSVPAIFKEYDGVTISGSTVDVNGDKVIYAVGGRAVSTGDPGEADWIMVTGLLDTIPSDPDTAVHIDRTVPALDYVCECQNRLWGCYYGLSNGETVNEICCSALGDFKNWRQYMGLSTDSWTGSVGSDGQWTGAVNYLGCPTFFKENRIHRVTVSAEGAHRIDETVCRGVQKGSAKSLVVVNETLYYKSRSDVCAYQGGFPTGVSGAFGTVMYHDAAAGAINSKYYLSMLDEAGAAHLFVYDIARGIWLREDDLRVTQFARVDTELFAVSSNTLCTLLGSLPVGGAEAEENVAWEAVTGIQYYQYPENKRATRYNIRMKLAQGATLTVYVMYNSSGVWDEQGTVSAESEQIDSFLFPVRTHRCDHLQLKLAGSGDVRIYSISKILEVGSDYR
ncbi:MAG: hypothetical protein IJP64_06285 [Oscillospiraceae bacterium]|nr:hypothetical protein [Oscillospiraceae bacterium]